MWQHNVIKKLARGKADDYVDIVKLCAAKERIEAMVEGAYKKLRKSGTNVKVARWLNDGQKGRRGVIERAAEKVETVAQDSDPEVDRTHALPDPEHPEAGISDFGITFQPSTQANGKGGGNGGQIESPRKPKAVRGKKGGRLGKATPPNSPPAQPPNQKRRKLDTTGWDFDYVRAWACGPPLLL